MSRLVCLFLAYFLLGYFHSAGQNSTTDGLRKSLDSLVGESRLEALINLASHYTTDSPDSLIKYSRQALKEAERLELKEYQAAAYYRLGVGYSLLQVHDDSVKLFYQSALNLTEDYELKADINQSKAGFLYDKGQYDEAIVLFLNGARIFDSLHVDYKLANAYGGVGNVFLAQNQYDKALEYLHKSRLIGEKNNIMGVLLPIYANIATVHNESEQYDSAIHYALQCHTLSKELGQTYGIAVSAQILTESYSQSKDYSLALQYAKESKELFAEMGAQNQVVATTIAEAKALNNLGQPQKALSLLNQAEEDISADSPQLQLSLLEALTDTYHALNDDKAFTYLQQYLEAYKEVNTTEKNARIQQLEIQYETEKNKQKIAYLEKENRIRTLELAQQKNRILVVVLVLIVAVLSVYFYYQKRLLKAREQSAVQKEQLLRSQINPHFIFNALTSIRGFLFDKKDLRHAIDYLGKFAKLMRMVLDHSSKELVTLEEEIKALKIYMEIQKMRFNDGFEYQITVDEGIEAHMIKVPPLLAQPFIENAIEHGFKNIAYQGKIMLDCKAEGDHLKFSITDNGLGIDSVEQHKNHNSKALSIFKQRLDLLSKQFKSRLTFLVKDLGLAENSQVSGTQIEYTLPIQ